MTNLFSSRSMLMAAVILATEVACGGSTSDATSSDGGGSTDGTANDGATSDGGSSTDGGAGDSSSVDSSSLDSSSVDASHADSSASDGGVPVNHRADDSQCSAAAPAGTCTLMNGLGACAHDTDCTTGTNGRCTQSTHGAMTCSCSYDACTHDADCGAGKLCVCHGSAYTSGAGNTCVAGNCRVDADCGAGKYCSPSHGTSGCGGVTGYYCHASSDECTNDSDCAGMGGTFVCAWSITATHWKCQQELLCP